MALFKGPDQDTTAQSSAIIPKALGAPFLYYTWRSPPEQDNPEDKVPSDDFRPTDSTCACWIIVIRNEERSSHQLLYLAEPPVGRWTILIFSASTWSRCIKE